MSTYVDGFVIPVPKTKLKAYFAMSAKAGKIWIEHGAIAYKECVGDDLSVKMGLPFPKGIKAKSTETVVFSWIAYKSRAQRDKVNAKVMKDPRVHELCKPDDMPFEASRMLYGGFKAVVDL